MKNNQDRKLITIELDEEESKTLDRILEIQIDKTSWVVGNKDPANAALLEKNISVMEDVRNQIAKFMETIE